MFNKMHKYLILGIVLGIILISIGTYAWFTWVSNNNTDVSFIVDGAKVLYVGGDNIENASITPSNTKEEGIVKAIKIKLDKPSNKPVTLNMYLKLNILPNGLKQESFKWEVYKGSTLVGTGNFANALENDIILLTTDTVTTTEDTYTLYLWIDGNMENPPIMAGLSFSFTLYSSGENALYEGLRETNANCFAFDELTNTITRYYEYENNNSANPTCPKNVVIPSQINGVDVYHLAEGTTTSNVFYQRNITSVILPNTLKTIGSYAFYVNKLVGTLIIPKSVTSIGNSSFYSGNQLTNLIFENGSELLSIGNQAFRGNKLGTLTLPNKLTTILYEAFEMNLLTNLVIPNSITYFGTAVFNSNNLPDDQAFIYKRNTDGSIDYTNIVSYGGANRSNVVIPNNVKTIGQSAFYLCSLTSVTIPSSVTSIGITAFNNNQLPPEQAIIYQRNADGSINYTNIVSYGGNATSITIPNGVTTIGNNAFNYSKLTSVVIPSTVTSISAQAFFVASYTNSNLTSIVNQTGRSFNWGSIINNSSGYAFETGAVTTNLGTTVNITSS